MDWNFNNMMGYGYWWWHLIGMIFWLAVIVGIVIMVVRMVQPKQENYSKDEPLLILKNRYASGEIDLEEFKQKKGDLGYK